MIVLEMKCPQLSKPEATTARNENSIGDRMEKKPLEKPGSVGGPVPLQPDESVVCSNKERVCLNPEMLSGRIFQSLGANYEKVLPPLVDFAILGTTKSPELNFR